MPLHDATRDLILLNQQRLSDVEVNLQLEANNEQEYALKKLQDKNLDLIVMNSLNDPGAGFNYDTNKVTLFDQKGNVQELPLLSKQEVAQQIVTTITGMVRHQ